METGPVGEKGKLASSQTSKLAGGGTFSLIVGNTQAILKGYLWQSGFWIAVEFIVTFAYLVQGATVSEPLPPPPIPEVQPSRPQPGQLQIDDSKILALYANFCRVTGTPEELIIDFGLNPQPFEVPTNPIPVTQRIITNFYTAKRMLHALAMTIERHEATFGVLEVNVERRVRSAPGR